MRKNLSALLACGMVLGLAGRGAADEAEKILDEAIKAHGGSANLTRARQMQRSASGTVAAGGQNSDFTDKLLVDLPDRSRHEITVGQARTRILTVLNGARGWQVVGGATQELNQDLLRELKDDVYLLYLTTLVPQRRLRRFDTKAIADSTIKGRKVAGIKVSSKGHEDVRLYFDKRSKLLVKAARTASVAGLTVEKVTLYSNHKDFNGVKLPTKITETINGRQSYLIKSASYRFPRLQQKSFAKP